MCVFTCYLPARTLTDITTSSEEFYEIDGEPEDRRRARLKRHMRTNERMVC